MPEPVVVGVFESKSRPGVEYRVLKHPDGSLTCDCPRFTNWPRPGEVPICSHVRYVMETRT